MSNVSSCLCHTLLRKIGSDWNCFLSLVLVRTTLVVCYILLIMILSLSS